MTAARTLPAHTARGWKHNRGWYVRTRSRSGAESKQKHDTYEEAHAEAIKARRSGQFKEIWIEEVGVVPRDFRDLEPRRQRGPGDRAHVLNVEESDA